MQRWEIRRQFVSFTEEVSADKSKDHVWRYSGWGDEATQGWAKAEALAAEGWDLVAVVPIIKGHEWSWKVGVAAAGTGCSYTEGMYLVFKRLRP